MTYKKRKKVVRKLYEGGGVRPGTDDLGSVLGGVIGGYGLGIAGQAIGVPLPVGQAVGKTLGGVAGNWVQNQIGGNIQPTPKPPNQIVLSNSQNMYSTGMNPYGNSTMYAEGGDLQQGMTRQGMTQFKGPRHEQGGIPLGDTLTEVEGGEVRVGNYVFSDRLGVPNGKGSFAALAQSIQKKYSKSSPNDVISKKSMNRELAQLAQVQEGEKQKMQAQRSQNGVQQGQGMQQGLQNGSGPNSQMQPQMQQQAQMQMQQPQQMAFGGPLNPGDPPKENKTNRKFGDGLRLAWKKQFPKSTFQNTPGRNLPLIGNTIQNISDARSANKSYNFRSSPDMVYLRDTKSTIDGLKKDGIIDDSVYNNLNNKYNDLYNFTRSGSDNQVVHNALMSDLQNTMELDMGQLQNNDPNLNLDDYKWSNTSGYNQKLKDYNQQQVTNVVNRTLNNPDEFNNINKLANGGTTDGDPPSWWNKFVNGDWGVDDYGKYHPAYNNRNGAKDKAIDKMKQNNPDYTNFRSVNDTWAGKQFGGSYGIGSYNDPVTGTSGSSMKVNMSYPIAGGKDRYGNKRTTVKPTFGINPNYYVTPGRRDPNGNFYQKHVGGRFMPNLFKQDPTGLGIFGRDPNNIGSRLWGTSPTQSNYDFKGMDDNQIDPSALYKPQQYSLNRTTSNMRAASNFDNNSSTYYPKGVVKDDDGQLIKLKAMGGIIDDVDKAKKRLKQRPTNQPTTNQQVVKKPMIDAGGIAELKAYGGDVKTKLGYGGNNPSINLPRFNKDNWDLQVGNEPWQTDQWKAETKQKLQDGFNTIKNIAGNVKPNDLTKTALSTMGGMYDVSRGINGANYESYGRMTPYQMQQLDPTQAIQQQRELGANAVNKIKNVGGQSLGQYLNNVKAVNTGVQRNVGDIIGKYDNANTQILNQQKAQNSQLQGKNLSMDIQQNDINARERDAASNNIQKGLTTISQGFNQQYADQALNQAQDQTIRNIISQNNMEYELDPDGNYVITASKGDKYKVDRNGNVYDISGTVVGRVDTFDFNNTSQNQQQSPPPISPIGPYPMQ